MVGRNPLPSEFRSFAIDKQGISVLNSGLTRAHYKPSFKAGLLFKLVLKIFMRIYVALFVHVLPMPSFCKLNHVGTPRALGLNQHQHNRNENPQEHIENKINYFCCVWGYLLSS